MTAFDSIDWHDVPEKYDAADLLAEGARPEDLAGLTFLPVHEQSAPTAPAAPGPSGGKQRRPGLHADIIARLEGYLVQRGVLPDAVGGWMRIDTGVPIGCDTGELVLDFLLHERHDTDLARTYVEETLFALVQTRRRERRSGLIAGVTGKAATSEGREALITWVEAVTGGGAILAEATTVMAHWLWLIKRMALGMRTEHDLMPILYGVQGSGKSTATERLCEPLGELATTMNASNLTDERKFTALATFMVGRWEEMQGSQKSDIEALKHTITSRQVTYRRLNTHNNEMLLRSCGFIGTSNNPVDMMIGDPTGARRFYQLTTPAVVDRERINRLDPKLIWQAVSEHDPAPILPVIHLVRESQVELVQKDAVSLWLENETWGQLRLIVHDRHEDFTIPPYNVVTGEHFDHLCARFKSFCLTVGQMHNNVVRFAQRLQQEGFTTTRRGGRNGPRTRMYHRPLPPIPPADPLAVTTADPGARSQTAPADASPSPADVAGTRSDADELAERGRKLRAEPSTAEDRFPTGPDADGELPFDDGHPGF